MTKQSTCPNCGKRFIRWRNKTYCSEICRKRAAIARLGPINMGAGTYGPNAENPENERCRGASQGHADVSDPSVSRNGGSEWTACNEITHKLTCAGVTVAYVMHIRDRGWFGRIGRDWSFGPSTLPRAKNAVEARLTSQDYAKLEGEKSWSGDCRHLL